MFDAVCAATIELEECEKISGNWKRSLDSFIDEELE
jgi:hypothetical protein